MGQSQWRSAAAFDLERRRQHEGATLHLVLDRTQPLPAPLRKAPESRYQLIEHPRSPLALLQLAHDTVAPGRITSPDSPYDPLLLLSLEQAYQAAQARRSSAICGWVLLDRDPVSVATRWTHCLDLHGHGGHRKLLRFYDPRVAIQLPALLSPGQWKYLWGNLQAWAVLDWRGTLTWLPAPAPDAALDPISRRLSPEQSGRLDRLGTVNSALMAWAQQGGAAGDGTAMTQADALVERCGRQYPASRRQDRIAFAALGLAVHPEFDRHPAVAARLDGTRPFVEALGAVPEAEWARIRHELNASPAQGGPPCP